MITQDKQYIVVANGKTFRFSTEDWDANKDEFMTDFPDADIAEVDKYNVEDSQDGDYISALAGGKQYGFNKADWDANQEEFLTDFPDAQMYRVRPVDYYYNQALATEAALEENAKRKEAWAATRKEGKSGASLADIYMLEAGLTPVGIMGQADLEEAQAYIAEGKAIDEERAALQEQYYNNPRVKAAREAWEKENKGNNVSLKEQIEQQYRQFRNENFDYVGKPNFGHTMSDDQMMADFARSTGNLVRGKDQGGQVEYDQQDALYRQALINIQEAEKARDYSSDDSFFAKLAKGQTDVYGSPDFWSRGIQEMASLNQGGNVAIEKFNKLVKNFGENLTEKEIDLNLSPAEKAYILSLTERTIAEAEKAAESDKDGFFNAYDASRISAEMVGYMADFLVGGELTGGAKTAMSKAISKWLVKNVSSKMAKGAAKTATKAVGSTISKSLASAASGILRVPVTGGAYGMMGDQRTTLKEDGSFRGAGESVLRGAALAASEYFSEEMGSVVEDVLGVPFKLGKSGWNAAFKNVDFGKIGQITNKIGGVAGKITNNDFTKLLRDQFGLNSIGEIGEEYINAFVTDITGLEPGALKELSDTGNLITMSVGMAPFMMLGGAVSMGQYINASNQVKHKAQELKDILLSKGYSEEQAAYLTDFTRATSAHKLNAELNPILKRLAVSSGVGENFGTTDVYKAVAEYANAVANYQVLGGTYEAQEAQQRDAKRAELEEKYQGRFYGEDGMVRMHNLANGKTVLQLSDFAENGEAAAIDFKTGEHVTFTEADINDRIDNEGNVLGKESLVESLDSYLSGEVMALRATWEQARMQRERQEQIDALSQSLPESINIGTEGQPKMLAIKGHNAQGVTVVDEDGNEGTMTWESIALKLGKPIKVLTDAQIADAEAEEIAMRSNERRAARATTDAQISDAQSNIDNTNAEIEELIPNPEEEYRDPNTGEIDQDAFWEYNPEGWADYNDRVTNDGGIDTMEQIESGLAKLNKQKAELDKMAIDSPNARKAVKAKRVELQEKIDRLTALQQKYNEMFAAAEQEAIPEEERVAENTIAMRERVNQWREKFGLTPEQLTVFESEDEIWDENARRQVRNGKTEGWYSTRANRAFVYFPGIDSMEELDKTIAHEVVTHYGLHNLMGEKAYNELMDKVWNLMSDAARNAYYNYPGVASMQDADKRRRAAAEEFVASIAENVSLDQATAEQKSIWQRIVEFFRNLFKDMDANFSEKDIADIVRRNYQQLADQAAQESVDEFKAEAQDQAQENIISEEVEETAPVETITNIADAAQQDPDAIDLSDGNMYSTKTEDYLASRIREYASSKEGKKAGWNKDNIEEIIEETQDLITAIHNASTGNEFYDEFAAKDPTFRLDWRDGQTKPIVTWTRANIEYKYDMSADLLCVNNEGLEEVLSSEQMVELMRLFNPSKLDEVTTKDLKGKEHTQKIEIGFSQDDYLELYNTLKDLGFVVPCKGCFDAAGRFKMLPSVAHKFAAAVNAVIDERNANPEAFDNTLKSKAKKNATIGGLPSAASTKLDAIRAGVAGDNLTEHIKWTQLMSADGQTKMLSDWGGIFRAWQRTGAGRPKDKLLPEPYYGDIVSQQTTIIGKYGEKTPSFKDILVNTGTGLRRNSHSEFRPVLAVDEIQFMRDAFIKNLTVFKYMKELDDVRLFGKMGVKFNMSFFPEYVPGTKAAGLDLDGNYIPSEESVGAREFPYIGEDGKRHYDGKKGWQEAQKHINKDVSLSSVILSIPHLIKALTDVPTTSDKSGMWGSLIPFHSSGATSASLYLQGLGRARANGAGHGFEEALTRYGEGVTNFEAVQNDRFGKGWVIVEGKKAGEAVEDGHKLEFANGNHYYNKEMGLHLFASMYIQDSELPEGALNEDGTINLNDKEKKAIGHSYEIDYNNKVREIGTPTAYKEAADFYLEFLPKIGLKPRFDFEVPEDVFLQMCADANVDPSHPKLGWKGTGNSWSPIDSEAYYSLFCDYGMTDPATGEWAPHNPVGYIDENGERVFRMPENTVEIIKEGLDRYSNIRKSESSKISEAIKEFAKRSVEKGRISQEAVDSVLGEDTNMYKTRTDSQREKLFDAAKAQFGLTNNFNGAGYMLPDGSLLDFSEANDGGNPNQRSLDHREIEGIIMDEGTEYDSRWMYLADFMNEGAIRLLPEYAGINLMKAPTKEQRQRLMDFIYKYNGEVILEIADERLNNVAYVEYDRRTSPARIFRDIDGYFNEGILPESNTMFKTSFQSANETLDNEGISIDDAALMEEYGLSDIELSKRGNYVTLSKIVVADKNKGNGTRFMNDLVKNADENGWTLTLTPDDTYGASSVSRLKKFYKRFGFKENKGRNTDFNTKESMVRVPESGNMFKTSAANNKSPEFSLPNELFLDDPIMFKVSRNNRQTISNWLNKRPDLNDEAKAEVLDYLDQFNDATLQLAVGKWYAQNAIKLPEDIEKCMQAVASAKKAKIDALKFASPMEIINEYGVIEPKVKPINPDKVSTLSKVRDLSNGISIYDVEDSEESRKNMREIINTHYGKNCSPWCILQGDENGKLTAKSQEHWRHYNGYPKQVAFKDGKLLAFSANDSEETAWWDRMDKSYSGVPVNQKIGKDKLGRTRTVEFDQETGKEIKVHGIKKVVSKDGISREWIWRSEKEDDIVRYGMFDGNGNTIEGFDKGSWNLPDFLVGLVPKNKLRYIKTDDGRSMTFNLFGGLIKYDSDHISFVERFADADITGVWVNGNVYKFRRNGKLLGFSDANNSYGGKDAASFQEQANEVWKQVQDIRKNAKSIANEMLDSMEYDPIMFSTKAPYESAKAFAQGVVNEFNAKYKRTVPTAVVYANSRPMVAEGLGIPVDELSDELFKQIRQEAKSAGGANVLVARNNQDGSPITEERILIFAKDQHNKSAMIDGAMFHENIHGMVRSNPALLDLGKWLFENREGMRAKIANAIEAAYPEEKHHEEMLAGYMGYMMSVGRAQEVLDMLPEEYKPLASQIYEEFGYIPEQEDSRRSDEYRRDNARLNAERDAIQQAQDQHQGEQGRNERGDNGEDVNLFKTEITPEVRSEMNTISAQAIVNGTYLKAPNGKDTNLTPEQWALVRTKNFKQWFGDWEVAANIKRGLSALRQLANGAETVRNAMRREELVGLGGTAGIEFSWGKEGKLDSNGYIRKGSGFAKILQKHGAEDALRIVGTIATGEIQEPYGPDNAKRVDIVSGEYQTTISLFKDGVSGSWVLTGFKIDPSTDAKGRGSDLSNATQDFPIHTREDLGAALESEANIQYFDELTKDISKVVDENGEPMVMHHGSAWEPLMEPKGKAVFRMNDGLLGKGAYFSNVLAEATLYAEIATGLDTTEEGNYELLQDKYVTDYFLNVRNEEDIYREGDDMVVVAKSPNQIKSATDNTGEFSEDADIRFKSYGTHNKYGQKDDYTQEFLDDIYMRVLSKYHFGKDSSPYVYMDGYLMRLDVPDTEHLKYYRNVDKTDGFGVRFGIFVGDITEEEFNEIIEDYERTTPRDQEASGELLETYIRDRRSKLPSDIVPSENIGSDVSDDGLSSQTQKRAAERGGFASGSKGYLRASEIDADISPISRISLLPKPRITAKQNAEYLKAVENGDTNRAENIVEDVAEQMGYTEKVFHGTPSFGFTRFESRRPSGAIFTTSARNTAANYGGDGKYASVRNINKGIKEAKTTQDVLDNAKSRFDQNWRIATAQEREAVITRVEDEAKKVVQKMQDLNTDFSNMPFELQEALSWMENIIYDAADGRENGNEGDALSNMLKEGYKRFRESREFARQYIQEHYNELTQEQARYWSYINGFEVGDVAIDAGYPMAQAVSESEVATVDGRSFLSIDELNENTQEDKNVGTYKLFGNLGSNPLVIDAGKKVWFDLDYNGMKTTDSIAEWAKANGYTSVIFKNIYDYGDLSDVKVFFEPSQVKSADAITYDNKGNIIPLSKRFNEQDEDIRFKTTSNTSTMNVDELVEQGKQKVAAGHKEAVDIFMDRIRAINGNLQQLRMAAAAQREYDKKTVDAIVKQAYELLEAGKLNDLSRGEIKRLLGAINGATGKNDLTNSVNRLMDVMIANQLRHGRDNIYNFIRIRGKKVDSRGVEVRGRLDIPGQQVMDAFRENISLSLPEIEEAIANAEDRLTSDSETIARNAEHELIGLAFAKQYVENIKMSENEEKALRKDVRDAEAEYKAGARDAKSYRDFAKVTEEAIRENRTQRVLAYQQLVDDLAKMVSGSVQGAKLLREGEKARVEQIQHYANSDLKGEAANTHKQVNNGFVNNALVQTLTSPLSTFEQWLRVFGKKSAEGKGYLYNHFMGEWNDATNQEYLGMKEANAILDAKAREVFGDIVKRWSDIFSIEKKLPTHTIQMWDDGGMKDYELTQGNLLYIYMVNKMIDGKMKLRKMGVSESDVDAIVRALDPRFVEIADWVQDEFLPSLRDKYNAVHERLFGAPMAAIDNYFPIKVNANARVRDVDLGVQESSARPSTITGSIIKRTKNSLALDVLGSNAFDVVLEHVQQMEHWAAFAEFNRDLNTLLSYRKFRNRVQNMTTIMGSGKEAWNNFRESAEIAAGVYQPKTAKADKLVTNAVKGLTAGKINFRLWTAMKQILSMPAFLPYTSVDTIVKGLITPWNSWNWAMENLPAFEKRWRSRQAGNVRLKMTEADWKLWQSEAMEFVSRIGMTPNAFVDAVTCSVGSKAVYDTQYARYRKDGYTHEKADKKAKLDATVAFNATQQSSEAAFLSAIQSDRTFIAHVLTVFRNNSFGMQRELNDALRNMKKRMTKGFKEESIEFMTKQMVRDGLTEEQAKRAAERIYRRSATKDAARVAVFGFLMQFVWALGGSAPYLLFGDDDDEKKEMLKDAAIRGAFGSIEGLGFGNVVADGMTMAITGELDKFNPSFSPAMADIANLWNKFEYDWVAGMNDLVNICVQAGFGVNPQILTDFVVAIVDACDGDMTLAKEVGVAAMRILQMPQSQIDNLKTDEIDFTIDMGLDVTIEQFAKEYAEYKRMKGAGAAGLLYSDEREKEIEEKYIKRFLKHAEELKRSRGNEEAKKYYEYLDTDYKEIEQTLRELREEQQNAYRIGNKPLERQIKKEIKAIEKLPEFDAFEAAKEAESKRRERDKGKDKDYYKNDIEWLKERRKALREIYKLDQNN